MAPLNFVDFVDIVDTSKINNRPYPRCERFPMVHCSSWYWLACGRDGGRGGKMLSNLTTLIWKKLVLPILGARFKSSNINQKCAAGEKKLTLYG